MNKTRADAFARVVQARTGSMVEPTLEYLQGLRDSLQAWEMSVDMEIRKLMSVEEPTGHGRF